MYWQTYKYLIHWESLRLLLLTNIRLLVNLPLWDIIFPISPFLFNVKMFWYAITCAHYVCNRIKKRKKRKNNNNRNTNTNIKKILTIDVTFRGSHKKIMKHTLRSSLHFNKQKNKSKGTTKHKKRQDLENNLWREKKNRKQIIARVTKEK